MSKRINVKLHFIRDMVEKGTVEVQKISTEENSDDFFDQSFM